MDSACQLLHHIVVSAHDGADRLRCAERSSTAAVSAAEVMKVGSGPIFSRQRHVAVSRRPPLAAAEGRSAAGLMDQRRSLRLVFEDGRRVLALASSLHPESRGHQALHASC